MAILPVLVAPDPRLKQVALPVESVDKDVRRLMDDMFETMVAGDGCGLAATQVGILKRIIVVDFSYKDPSFKPLFMANPEIIQKSEDVFSWEEACLSVPGQSGKVTRASCVTVRYLDRDNRLQELILEDQYIAGCMQHEIDHLDGILYIDHLSALKKQMILTRLRKQK